MDYSMDGAVLGVGSSVAVRNPDSVFFQDSK